MEPLARSSVTLPQAESLTRLGLAFSEMRMMHDFLIEWQRIISHLAAMSTIHLPFTSYIRMQ